MFNLNDELDDNEVEITSFLFKFVGVYNVLDSLLRRRGDGQGRVDTTSFYVCRHIFMAVDVELVTYKHSKSREGMLNDIFCPTILGGIGRHLSLAIRSALSEALLDCGVQRDFDDLDRIAKAVTKKYMENEIAPTSPMVAR